MKKIFYTIIAVLLLINCGTGGSTNGGPDNYIYFDNDDFAGKTVYLAEFNVAWAKCEFSEDGTLKAYEPGQLDWYVTGTWAIIEGKLIITKDEEPADKFVYYLTSESTCEKSFIVLRYDQSVSTVKMFYDSVYGLETAQEYAAGIIIVVDCK